MTICNETGLACNCQPDEGMPCSALNGGLKTMMLEWRAEAIRLQSRLDAQQPAAASAGANDWRETLEAIEAKATGGLCQFSLTGKHAFLGDIRELVRAALRSPPVATTQQSEAPK